MSSCMHMCWTVKAEKDKSPREQHRAGSNATRLAAYHFVQHDVPCQSWNHHFLYRHEQSFFPCNKFLHFLSHITAELLRQPERWLRPNQHHMPNQIPNWFDFLNIKYFINLQTYTFAIYLFFFLIYQNHAIKLIIEILPRFNSAAKHMGYMISAIKRDTTETQWDI